jgi:hypothetical protein
VKSGEYGILDVVKSESVKSIKWFDFRGNRDEFIAQKFPALERLELVGCCYGDRNLMGLHKLKELVLSSPSMFNWRFFKFRDLGAVEILKVGDVDNMKEKTKGYMCLEDFVEFGGNLRNVEISGHEISYMRIDFTQTRLPKLETLVIDFGWYPKRRSRLEIRGTSDSLRRLTVISKRQIKLIGVTPANLPNLTTLIVSVSGLTTRSVLSM